MDRLEHTYRVMQMHTYSVMQMCYSPLFSCTILGQHTQTQTHTHTHTHTCSETRHKLGCNVHSWWHHLFPSPATSKAVTTQTVSLIGHNHYDSTHDPSLLTNIYNKYMHVPKIKHTFTVRYVQRFTCAHILTPLIDTSTQSTLHAHAHINQTQYVRSWHWCYSVSFKLEVTQHDHNPDKWVVMPATGS